MRRLLRLILALAAFGLIAPPGHAGAPREGQPVPQFAASTLDGGILASSTLKGKVTLVHFWATWCAPCREEMPALDKFYREHRQEGFQVLAISLDDDEDLARVREFARPFAFPVAMKSAARVEGFGRLWALPLSFLIDRDGILKKGDWTGQERIDRAALERLVLPLLTRKPSLAAASGQ